MFTDYHAVLSCSIRCHKMHVGLWWTEVAIIHHLKLSAAGLYLRKQQIFTAEKYEFDLIYHFIVKTQKNQNIELIQQRKAADFSVNYESEWWHLMIIHLHRSGTHRGQTAVQVHKGTYKNLAGFETDVNQSTDSTSVRLSQSYRDWNQIRFWPPSAESLNLWRWQAAKTVQ